MNETYTPKWEPKRNRYMIDEEFDVLDAESLGCSIGGEFSRATTELAERAAREIKLFTRLLAYRDEFDPDFDYPPKAQYFVTYNSMLKEWEADFDECTHRPCVVYMSQGCAEQLADKLNSGEVTL